MNDSTPSIQAVFFDLGGVLVSRRPDYGQFAKILGYEADDRVAIDLLGQASWCHRSDYDAGQSSDVFWDMVAGDCGHDELSSEVTEKLVEADSSRYLVPDQRTVALASALKRLGVSLGILTNAPKPIAQTVRSAPWAQPFDTKIFSCDVGVTKPNVAIYRATAQAVDLTPANILLIDDRSENLRGAAVAGFQTLLWESSDSAARSLADLGLIVSIESNIGVAC